jgi:hypothetical protein
MTIELERIRKKVFAANLMRCTDIFLEGMSKTTKNVSQDSGSSGRDLSRNLPSTKQMLNILAVTFGERRHLQDMSVNIFCDSRSINTLVTSLLLGLLSHQLRTALELAVQTHRNHGSSHWFVRIV